MSMSAMVLSLLLAAAAGPPEGEPVARVAPVRVVATLPIYGAIVSAIGGAEVDVSSIADPREDAHFVRPKPSFAAGIRRADMFITTGLDLELWVPPLLDKAANARVSEGGQGYVTTYTGIKLLDVPSSTDRSAGDIHMYGNPHVFTDPLNAIIVARNITTGLKKVAPERSAVWDKGLASFTAEIHRRLYGDKLIEIVGADALDNLARTGKLHAFLDATPYEGHPLAEQMGGWLSKAEAFRGHEIICYHKNWAYFEDRFGVHCADYVEAKPGIPPTPGHVAELINTMKSKSITVMIAADYFGKEKVETVAKRAGATAVMMPLQPTGDPGMSTYFDVVDRWVNGLAAAFRGVPAAHHQDAG
jgi:zinc/manganese transport system substrate-binding protein